MSRLAVLLTTLGLLTGFSQMTYGADAAAGKVVADGTCIACHGQNGIGIIPLYPNLAGQKAEYLVAQMRAFRDGDRKNPIMSPMAVHLTDADIDAVALYYATLRNP